MMITLYCILFMISVICFPVSFGAMFRLILKNAPARLTGLLAASVMIFCWQMLSTATGISYPPSPSPFMDASDNLWLAFCIVTSLMFSYVFSLLGIKLVDTIREQNKDIEIGQTLLTRMKPMFCNALVILLSLSFVFIGNIGIMTCWLRILGDMSFLPLWGRRLLLRVPEIVLFCIVGFAVTHLFSTARRIQWVLALVLAASLVQIANHLGNYPGSPIIPPLLTPWFVMVGYTASVHRMNRCSRMSVN